MRLSRRKFLTTASGAAAGLLWLHRQPGGDSYSELADCLLFDLGGECSLPESLKGYDLALRAANVNFLRSGDDVVAPSRTILVPAVASLSHHIGCWLNTSMLRGARVVLESGLGFVDSATWAEGQRRLQKYFDLEIGSPVNVWSELKGHWSNPYVDYHWPFPTKIRDFSRAVPPSPRKQDNVIGWLQGMPVGLERNVGRGSLIFLGSPMGPALLAGEPEAHRWLAELLRSRDERQVDA